MIDLSQVTDIMLGNETVTQIQDSLGNVLWSAAPAVTGYFYVEDVSGLANTLSIVGDDSDGGTVPANEIFYSTNQTNWTSMGITSTIPITATIPANTKLYLKSTNSGLTDGNDLAFTMISASGNHNIGGYIMSLVAGDNFENAQPGVQSYFKRLFKNDTALVDASRLVLPTNPTTAIYAETFRNCTSLTTAPNLPITTLSLYCYYHTFDGCSSLNSVTTYANDISEYNCLTDWLNNVAATGTFHNMTCLSYPSGASGIPTGWAEVHSTGSTINVTITNTSNYSGATYQIDNSTAQPINITGTTTFTVPTSATNLTIERNGRGATEMLGICGMSEDTEWTTVIPVNKMSNTVSIDLISLT